MRKSRKSKHRVSRRRVSRRRVSRHRGRRVSRRFRYSIINKPLIDTCSICLQDKLELIPLGCGGGRHGLCKDCIVPTMRVSTRCPLCREPVDLPFFSAKVLLSVYKKLYPS